MRRLFFAAVMCMIFLECSAFGAASDGGVSFRPAMALYVEDLTEEGNVPVSVIKQRMYSELSKFRAFSMEERDELTSIRDTRPAGNVSIGKVRPANLITIGSVTFCHYSAKASGNVIPFLGIEIKAKTAYVVLCIRIVDAETSSVVYASAHVGEAVNNGAGKQSSEILARAANNAADKSVSAMKNLAWLNSWRKAHSRVAGGVSSRPRLAVSNFLYDGDSGEWVSSGAISSLIVTKLYEFGFELVEREHTDYIAEELKLVSTGLADQASAPENGKIKAAQYVLIGAMTFHYSKKASKTVIPALGIAPKADTAYAKLEIRVADVSTGSIVFRSAHIGENSNKNNRGTMNHNGMVNPIFWKAAGNAMEKSISELQAVSWLNPPQKTPSQPKPPAPSTNNIKAMTSKSSVLDMPRVYIDDFEDKTEDRNAPIDSIMTMMVTELHKAGIFSLVERKKISLIADEIGRSEAGLVDSSTALKSGKLWGFQYFITGAVTLRRYDEKGSGFMLPILGTASKAKTAYVVIDMRIVDAETGNIIYADNQMGAAVNKEKKTIGSYESMVGGLLDMAARDAVKKHVSEMKAQASQI